MNANHGYRLVESLVTVVWLAAMICAFTLGDDRTRNAVRIALVYYAVAMWFMLGLRIEDWRRVSPIAQFARWCWTLAWAAFVIHVAAAFHFYHHWSHGEAVHHVHERSGVGEGIFVSYSFTLLWTIDVALCWIDPIQYGRRSQWINQLIYGFMLLIVFFGTVVYEDGLTRWVGLVLCIGLALRYWHCSPSPLVEKGTRG